MGVFIRNKKMQKSDEKKPVLINTKPNELIIGDEIPIIEKKSIKSGLGDKKATQFENKKAVIDNVTVVDKTNKKVITTFNNPETIKKETFPLTNKTQNIHPESDKIITTKPVINNSEFKFKQQLNKFKPISTDNKYYDFVFGVGVLTDNDINNMTTKLNGILVNRKITLSFMDLFFFRSFIKNKSIALIANSSDLLDRSLGGLIDSHDIVIRFNSYKLLDKDTGVKTTIHASIYLQDENLNEYVPIRFILSNSLSNWSNKLVKIDKYKQGSILKYSHHAIIPSNFKEPHPSTTGFSTLILLLKLGGYHKINMFGFNFYEDGVNSIFRNDAGMDMSISNVHNYLFEKEFIIGCSYEYDDKKNIITFYDHSTF